MTLRVNGQSAGGGGGASLPVADPADLLSGATPERIVAIDDAGDGALLTAAQAAALLGVDAESLAAELAHTPTSATMRFLWYCNEASGPLVNRGTVSGADLTASGSTTQGSLLLASLNGRGLRCSGSAGSSASGGINKTPGVDDGLTWWAVFTVIAPPTARRATVLTRNANNAFTAPYNSLAIVIDSATAPAARSVVVEIGRQSGGYLEHVITPRYTDGVQMSVVATMSGTAWLVYVNGALVNTYGDGAAINWGDGTGYWQVGANASGEESNIHVTEAGCDARVWTSADVIELEQRRLGRWRG